jgi:5-methylcytosine-specific restriction endonuclease McrA
MSLSAEVAALFQPYVPAASVAAASQKPVNHHQRKKRLIARILDAQGGFCGICGNRLNRSPSVDHVVPRRRGGGNAGNRLIAHVPCNFRKADRMPTGCELLMLAAVNDRLGRDLRRPHQTDTEGSAV